MYCTGPGLYVNPCETSVVNTSLDITHHTPPHHTTLRLRLLVHLRRKKIPRVRGRVAHSESESEPDETCLTDTHRHGKAPARTEP